MTGAPEGPMTDEPGASVRMPLSEEMLARYRWAVAPHRQFLRRVVRRAYRRRRWSWGLFASNLLLVVGAILCGGAVLTVIAGITGPDETIIAIELYFILFVFAAFHVRSRVEEIMLRPLVGRFPRWYLSNAKKLGIRANVRTQLAEALRTGNTLRAWRIVEELLGERGTIGPTCRWLRSGWFGPVWNAIVCSQYVCWFLVVLSTMPGRSSDELRSFVLMLLLAIVVAMVVMIAIGQHRLQRVTELADPTSWADRCVRCDYNLRGLHPVSSSMQPVIICPECGTAHGA